jgi:hypothetical protein
MAQDFRICADEVVGCSIVKSVQEIGFLARTSLPMESFRRLTDRTGSRGLLPLDRSRTIRDGRLAVARIKIER